MIAYVFFGICFQRVLTVGKEIQICFNFEGSKGIKVFYLKINTYDDIV